MAASAVCVPGYSSRVRDVSDFTRRAVYREYGITHHARYGNPGSYEIDHLVPLELGGSNSMKNLWPEAYPGYKVKDVIENSLHRDVCAGRIELKAAQQQIERAFTR